MSSEQKARKYGNRWNPIEEDPARCVAGIWNRYSQTRFQCSSKRGNGPDGLYCGTHDPDRRAEKQRKRDALREAERKLRMEHNPLTVAQKRIEVLETEVARLRAELEGRK